jgi:hypothetical protein
MFAKKPQIITSTLRKEYSGKAGYSGFSVEGSKKEDYMPSSGVLFSIPKGTCVPYLDQYGKYVTLCCDKEGKSCTAEKLLDGCHVT